MTWSITAFRGHPSAFDPDTYPIRLSDAPDTVREERLARAALRGAKLQLDELLEGHDGSCAQVIAYGHANQEPGHVGDTSTIQVVSISLEEA